MGNEVGAYMQGANLKLAVGSGGQILTEAVASDYANVLQNKLDSSTYGSSVGKYTAQGNAATTDATVTAIVTIAVPTDYAIAITGMVVGKKVDTADGLATSINISGGTNNGGTLAEIAAENVTTLENSAGTPAVTVTVSGTNIIVNVAGIAAENWRWFCHLEYILVQAT